MPRLMVDASLAAFQRNAAQSVAMLKALSNGKRLMILCKLLEHGEMNVMDLSAAVGLSQSALSQHLALMRAQKLQKRAARTGFDWPDPSGSEAKIFEEIEELKSIIKKNTENVSSSLTKMCIFLDEIIKLFGFGLN